MKLKILGSSSRGNCYVLENQNSALIIECGVRFLDVKKALNYDISKIVGCIISHSHGDHCGYIQQYINAGINVFLSEETNKELPSSNFLNKVIYKTQELFEIGFFSVLPFELLHDVKCHGFLIDHPETGTFCFITDTHYSPFRFADLNNIMIECNYSKELLDAHCAKLHPMVMQRTIKSHISLDTCKEFLKANDLTKVNNIILLHLSDGNSDEQLFINEIKKLTGKNIHAAKAGIEIDFNKNPF